MVATTQKPIKFGTDGWRGVIADDFTFDRVAIVARASALVLKEVFGEKTGSNTILVGYDRRFQAEAFAKRAAEAVRDIGFDVRLSASYAPTPAFSWAANQQNALGSLVLTASHNPAPYLGVKVKGNFGGSVSGDVTKLIEARLDDPIVGTTPGTMDEFDPWQSYCDGISAHVNMDEIRAAIASGAVTVFADVMHGAAAGGLARLLDAPVRELNSDRDPLFGGGAPEPLPRYLAGLFQEVRSYRRQHPEGVLVGFVFDGDCDRIAAVDSEGNFLSSQVLIPILIEHFAKRRGKTGEVVKTFSGSDLMPRVAELYGLPVYETPIGYKYIAERMLSTQVLLGGEESGGIGYGNHIPERDALLSALYVLEAIVQSQSDLSDLYRQLQEKTNFTSAYDRIDLPLASMDVRETLVRKLESHPLQEIAGKAVTDCGTKDGYKFRLEDGSWLLVRFSGTEPVLRLYCEAADMPQVHKTLNWAKDWAHQVGG